MERDESSSISSDSSSDEADTRRRSSLSLHSDFDFDEEMRVNTCEDLPPLAYTTLPSGFRCSNGSFHNNLPDGAPRVHTSYHVNNNQRRNYEPDDGQRLGKSHVSKSLKTI